MKGSQVAELDGSHHSQSHDVEQSSDQEDGRKRKPTSRARKISLAVLGVVALGEIVARAFGIMDSLLKRGVERGGFRSIDTACFLAISVGSVLFTLLWRHSIGRHTDIHFNHHAVLDGQIDIRRRGLAPDPTP